MTQPKHSTAFPREDKGASFTLEEFGLLFEKAYAPGCAEALQITEFRPDRLILTAIERQPIAEQLPIAVEKPPKRQRKPRLDRLIAQAEKASGKTISSITMPDGTTVSFGEPEPTAATNPWLADLKGGLR